MNIPVLFIVFRRYDTALQVFEAIRMARPPRLYVAADAPRPGIEGEEEECRRTRDIVKLVDWPCEVFTLFQTENQGCGAGPCKAITWFFEHEEMGIVLEDDCVPHPDFFDYCEELLVRYRHDERVALITGRCDFDIVPAGGDSYFTSAMHFCWGWASWRRVWAGYDYTLAPFTAWRYYRALRRYFPLSGLSTVLWRMNIFFMCKRRQPRDAWDYQFCISTQMHHQFTLVPKVNLVKNIGFDDRATHTGGFSDNRGVGTVMPLHHPAELTYDPRYDIRYSYKRQRPLSTWYCFIRNLLHI